MRRAYVDVSHFRSPYDSPTLSLTGLGSMPTRWQVGRSYVDVAHFRAPYDQGYFQDNQLFGLGAEVAPPNAAPATLPAPPPDMLGSTLALIGIGAVVGAAGAFIVMRGKGA